MSNLLPPTLSVVTPCYNEEEVLPETAERIAAQLQRMINTRMIGEDSHVLFVDDGSSDRTWPTIEELHRKSRCILGLKLSHNRGHQNALLAGLLSATGDIVVSIDADLQDDPELMTEMVLANAAGADVVLAVRRTRTTDNAFKRITAELYYRCLLWMNIEITYNHGDYRLLSRRAIEALRQYGESNLFLRALVMEIGFKAVVVSYDRAPRFAGSSKCPLRKMIALAPRRRHSIFYNAAPLHHAGRSTDLSRYRIYRKDLSRDQASTAFHNRSGPTRDQKRSEPSLAQNT